MTDKGWIGTKHCITIGAKIVGYVYCPRRGPRDAMQSATRTARMLYGPDASPMSGTRVYPGDPIEQDMKARVIE